MDKNIEVLSRKIATAFSEFTKAETEINEDIVMSIKEDTQTKPTLFMYQGIPLQEVEFNKSANKGDFDFIEISNSNETSISVGIHKAYWNDWDGYCIVDNDGALISLYYHIMEGISIRAFKKLEFEEL